MYFSDAQSPPSCWYEEMNEDELGLMARRIRCFRVGWPCGPETACKDGPVRDVQDV
jgi:hypothetical protein